MRFGINASLGIGKHNYSFGGTFGWYSGSELSLLTIKLFELYIDGKIWMLTIFDIQIAKFSIGLSLNRDF
jgi:hypothetical protein